MNWLLTITTVFHVLLAAAIIGLVLIQRGKGADAGAGFGAGASGTVFGARGSASFMSRATAVLATLFIVTSLSLAYMGSRQTDTAPSSVIDRVGTPVSPRTTELPALPSETAPPVEAPSQNTNQNETPAQ